MPPHVVVAAVQVPFTTGGAEWHVEALHGQLQAHGFRSEVVQLPFQWSPRREALKSALAWRFLDLRQSNGTPIDRVIATRFPSYALRHPAKVLWLFHPFRQAYDLHDSGVDGFPDTEEGRELRSQIVELDKRLLAECRRVFTTSDNNAARLRRHTGVEAEVLRVPLLDPEGWRDLGSDGYVLSVGRLDSLKRTDRLVRAAAHLASSRRVIIVGDGPLRAELETLATTLGVTDRVSFAGRVDDARLREMMGRAACVYYAPHDEDYGLVTLEAFHCGKPVVTLPDAGGPLEFVRDGETGFVAADDPGEIAARLEQVLAQPERSREIGARGRASVQDIRWGPVIERLTEGMSA